MINVDLNTLSPSALAYLGDSVIELMVREYAVEQGVSDAGKLNDIARHFVTAVEQSTAVQRILPCLTEEETVYFKRGRNIHSSNIPKSSSVAEYRRATGFEVLFGYLHVTGQENRKKELFDSAYKELINHNNLKETLK